MASKLIIYSITYNGSDDPNECLESVDWGVQLPTESGIRLFQLGYLILENIRARVGPEDELHFEVEYFDQPDERTGAAGFIRRVVRDGQLIYTRD